MKRIIYYAGLLMLATPGIVYAGVPKTNEYDNHIYIQGLIGPNLSMNEDTRFGNFKHTVNWGSDIALGKDFTPYWGHYINFLYNKNMGMAHYSIKPRIYNTFHSLELFINGEYNLTNGLLGVRKHRNGNLYGFAGVGVAYSFGVDCNDVKYKPTENEFSYGLRIGFTYEYLLSRRVAAVANIGATGMSDMYNGRKAGVPFDLHINAQIGFRFYIGKGATDWARNPPIQFVDREKIVYRTEYKTDTVRIQQDNPAIVASALPSTHIYPVFFAINSIDIRDSERDKLDDMAEYMKKHPEKVVFILGQADKNTGNSRINYYLGKNRSRVVAEELTNKYGISNTRIITIMEEADKIQPYKVNFENNRVAICIVTDFKE